MQETGGAKVGAREVGAESGPRNEKDIRESEIREVTRGILSKKAKEARSKAPSDRSEADRVLSVYEILRTGRHESGKAVGKIDFGGNGIVLPKLEFSKGAKDYSFDDGALKIDTVATDRDGYKTTFTDATSGKTLFLGKNGIVVRRNIAASTDADQYDKDMQQATTDGLTIMDVTLPSVIVADAQALSEFATIETAIDDDNKIVFRKFGDTYTAGKEVPTGSETDDLITKAAESAGMLRRSDLDAIVASLPDTARDDLKKRLSEVDGQLLISADEFNTLFKQQEQDGMFDAHAKALQAKIDGLEAKIASPEDGDDVLAITAERDTVAAQLSAVQRAEKSMQADSTEKAAAKAAEEPWTQPSTPEFADMDRKALDLFTSYAKQLEDVIDGNKLERKALLEAQNDLMQVRLAQRAQGTEFGPMLRVAVLSKLQENSSAAKMLLNESDAYIQEAQNARQRFDIFLSENGITDSQLREDVLRKLQSADGITSLAEDSRFAAIAPKFIEGTFGSTEVDVYNLLDQAAIAHQNVIEPSLMSRLQDVITRNPGKSAGILAAILLAIAATPIVLGVAVVGGIGKGVKG